MVTQLEGPPLLLRKLAADRMARAHQHWLTVKTVGKRSNKDGFGARVDIRAGGLSQTQEIRANSSYLSASDSRVHFGLRAATKVDSLAVRWPSGTVDRLSNQLVDRQLVVTEGEGVTARNELRRISANPRSRRAR